MSRKSEAISRKSVHLTHTDITKDSRILKEMMALTDANYKVSGIGVALDDGSAESKHLPTADIISINLRSRKFTFLPRPLRHVISLIEISSKMLPKAIRMRPGVVHCHDTLALPLGLAVKAFTGAKLIYDAHELESDRNGLSWLDKKITLWAEKLLWRFIDGLIVVSPSIERWYAENVGPKLSTVVLNSPLVPNEGIGRSAYLRNKFDIPGDRKIFIYIGILGRGRGLEAIFQAFAHPQTQSHIVFLGYGELSLEARRLSAQHVNFHFHDAVPHTEVVPIARSADMGLCLVEKVSLSDYYCLPNKLFEYCFAGIPVLASDFPDIRQVITQYGIGECCGNDPDSIIRALASLQDSKLDYLFGDLTPLTWRAQEKKLLDLYLQFSEADD